MTAVPSTGPGSNGETGAVERGSGNDGDHRVQWKDGQATFRCLSPEGSACRCWCTRCDEGCPLTDDDGTEHVWRREASCRVIDYLDAYGAFDSYAVSDEAPPEVDGPIRTEWNGDTYLWEPKTEADR